MTTTVAEMAIPNETKLVPSYRGAWVALFLLFSIVYFGSLTSPALLDDADAGHSEAAREMYASGDYVTLHINGIRYMEKPPLPYWLVAAGFHIFGVHELAVRLPSALAIFLLMVLAYRWGCKAFDRRVGVYTALFVTTAIGYYLFSRILIPEALLSLLIAASLWFFLTALEPQAAAWRWYAGYTCAALAVLAKGLIGIVFIGAIMLVFVVLSGDWRRWREFRLFSGTLLFLLIAAPWHLLAGFRNQRFFWFYFVNEHFLRFLGKRYPRDYNKLPAYLYWSLHLAWLFPWSMYFPLALKDSWQTLKSKVAIPRFEARTRLMCWIWAGIILVFFALSTNQEYYTYPAYFPLIMTVFLSAAHIALQRFEPYLSSKPLAEKIAAQIQPSDQVMIYGDQSFGTSLLFYLQRPIELVNGKSTSMWFGSTFPDAPKRWVTDDDLLRAWNSPTRVFLFVTTYQKARVESLIQLPKYAIAESSGKTIYSNQPNR